MFTDVISSEAQLRAILGDPSAIVSAKVIDHLDTHCRAFIAQSPFALVGTSDAAGNLDVSPRGDAPGFAQVLDDHTLLLPERRGNRRIDTLRNIVQHPKVGLIFLVPGHGETLRVNGRAQIVRDHAIRERFVVQNATPEFVIAVGVDEAFLHCAKCMHRSGLWAGMPANTSMPSIGEVIVDHARVTTQTADEITAAAERDYVTKLY